MRNTRLEFCHPRGRCRGAASVEAAIALPIVVLLLFGVLYVSRSITQRHRADDLARSCAWKYSTNGCFEVPPGCEDVVQKVTREGDAAETLESKWGEVMDVKTLFSGKEQGFDGLIAAILSAVFGDVITRALVKDAKGSVQYRVNRGGMGQWKDEFSASYQLPCNIKETTIQAVAEEAWDEAIASAYGQR